MRIKQVFIGNNFISKWKKDVLPVKKQFNERTKTIALL